MYAISKTKKQHFTLCYSFKTKPWGVHCLLDLLLTVYGLCGPNRRLVLIRVFSVELLHHIHVRRDIKFRRHLPCVAFRAIRCWQCHLTCTARWFHTNSHLHSWKLVNLRRVLNGCDSLSELMMRTGTTSTLQRWCSVGLGINKLYQNKFTTFLFHHYFLTSCLIRTCCLLFCRFLLDVFQWTMRMCCLNHSAMAVFDCPN